MSFNTKTVMDQKIEFVQLALKKGANISKLCKRFEISRKTGYKWLNRYHALGEPGLENRSTKPHKSPNKTASERELQIIKLRKQNPEWGAKKLHKILLRENTPEAPSRSTINNILNRHGLITDEKSKKATAWKSFEYAHPNELWQMDFKGYFSLLNKQTCHPLTITDDHSRFNLCLDACSNQTHNTVKNSLSNVFRKYGLPDAILADNGSPWASTGNNPTTGERGFSRLEMWLIKQNIRILHGRPYHPQTQGKEERFHRTLKSELLQYRNFNNLEHCQEEFNIWRNKYNTYRPHEAIGMETPISRYAASKTCFKEIIEPPLYDINENIIKVKTRGVILFNKKTYRVGKAFIGEYVAVKPTVNNKIFKVNFYNQSIRTIHLQ